jgi:3',5'-cyclic-AMP phosphodiesterase
MMTTDDSITFVVPGDLHLTEPGLDNDKVASWMVDEVNDLIRPDFVQFIGDNVQDATEDQFRLFDRLRGRLAVPHHALVGDHDVKGDPGARGFRAHLGDTYGATRLRGFRFLRLDTQQARPLGLSPGQIDWFRGEVDAALAADERVVIFQHNYPYQIWEDFAGPGIDDWRAITQTRSIQAIVCGHTHYGQVANDGRNISIATRSIGDPEGGPPGYSVGYLHGEDLAVTYRSAEDRGPLALVTHPREAILATKPRHVVTGPDQFRLRTWSASPLAEVHGRLDGGPWFPLDPQGINDWTAPLPGDRLAKGTHCFEVEARDREGRKAGQRMDFMVDPTGRYTAVPSVQPRVTQTSFC